MLGEIRFIEKKGSSVDPHSLYWRKGRRSRGHQPRCDRPLPTKFTLRQAESSSHCHCLGYQECQAPVPHRLLHSLAEYSVLEQLSSLTLFQGIKSSASQANENQLVGTSRPPLKHNMQKRRNFRLGDARGNTFHRKKKGSSVDSHSLYWRKGRRSRGHQPRCDRPLPTKFTLRQAEFSTHCHCLGYQECQARVPHRFLHSLAEYSVLEQLSSLTLFQGIKSSASQANENQLVGTSRPPLKHNMQKRRNFRLGDVYKSVGKLSQKASERVKGFVVSISLRLRLCLFVCRMSQPRQGMALGGGSVCREATWPSIRV